MPIYTYIPLSYNTYNYKNYYASLVASVLFFAFYIILFLIFKYELYNQRNICDPMFYYGRACRNEIADRILTDPTLVTAKHAFYNTMQNQINPNNDTDDTLIADASGSIQTNLHANDNFVKDTVKQIQEVTDIVNVTASKYLGNLRSLVNSTKETSNATWEQLQNIPKLLIDMQTQINQAIITPSLARYVDPLQKLYKSLSDIQPAGQGTT